MSFNKEQEAFDAWARTSPNNGIFLVDTYDTLAGVDHAIAAGRKLRASGKVFGGVRLDSGDLAWLSREARKKLDAAGFAEAQVVASNDLNERVIRDLKTQGAAIDVWGVGTQLATAYDQPALGGVYKLAALQEDGRHPRRKMDSEGQAQRDHRQDQPAGRSAGPPVRERGRPHKRRRPALERARRRAGDA